MIRRHRQDLLSKKQELQALIHQRTKESIARKNELFAQEHQNDTEAQLLQYVCEYAEELGRTPNCCEIIGGNYIATRFGDWKKVVAAAGLPNPEEIPMLQYRLVYKKEFKLQIKALRQQEKLLKEQKLEECRQKNAVGQALVQKQKEADRLWGEEHSKDTEEELLAYVKESAARLGHSPRSKEVPGATYIAGRIGSWALVLQLCGLEMPPGVEPPNPKTRRAYLERKKKDQGEASCRIKES